MVKLDLGGESYCKPANWMDVIWENKEGRSRKRVPEYNQKNRKEGIMIARIFALVFAAAALCAEEYNFTASPAQTLSIREGQRKCVVVRQGKQLAEVYIFGRPGETGLLKLSRTPEGLTLDPTEYFKTVPDKPNLNLRAVFDLGQTQTRGERDKIHAAQ